MSHFRSALLVLWACFIALPAVAQQGSLPNATVRLIGFRSGIGGGNNIIISNPSTSVVEIAIAAKAETTGAPVGIIFSGGVGTIGVGLPPKAPSSVLPQDTLVASLPPGGFLGELLSDAYPTLVEGQWFGISDPPAYFLQVKLISSDAAALDAAIKSIVAATPGHHAGWIRIRVSDELQVVLESQLASFFGNTPPTSGKARFFNSSTDVADVTVVIVDAGGNQLAPFVRLQVPPGAVFTTDFWGATEGDPSILFNENVLKRLPPGSSFLGDFATLDGSPVLGTVILAPD